MLLKRYTCVSSVQKILGGIFWKNFLFYITLADARLYRLALWDSFKTPPRPRTGLRTGSLLKFDLKTSASVTLKVLRDPDCVVLHLDEGLLSLCFSATYIRFATLPRMGSRQGRQTLVSHLTTRLLAARLAIPCVLHA